MTCMYMRFLPYAINLTIFHSVDSSCTYVLSLQHSPRKFYVPHTSRRLINPTVITLLRLTRRLIHDFIFVFWILLRKFRREYVNSLFCKYLRC
jgi:hypothetical protein